MKKVGTEENWGDLGTKALDGWRITQLIGIMPMKRGLVVASLIASAMAQGPEEQKPVGSIMSVCPVHVRTAHSCPGRFLVHHEQRSTEIPQCRISDISPHWRTGDPS